MNTTVFPHPRSQGRHEPSHSSSSYLLPKVVLRFPIHERCVCSEFTAESIPCHAKPPYCLEHISIFGACGFLPDDKQPGRFSLIIPAQLCIRDHSGNMLRSSSVIQFAVSRSMPCIPPYDQIHIHASLRLLQPISSDSTCFRTHISIIAEVFFLNHTIVCFNIPQNCCLDHLPLYPQPCNQVHECSKKPPVT